MELFSLVDAVARAVGLTIPRHNVLEEDSMKECLDAGFLENSCGIHCEITGT